LFDFAALCEMLMSIEAKKSAKEHTRRNRRPEIRGRSQCRRRVLYLRTSFSELSK
jgi:hypothetical protein